MEAEVVEYTDPGCSWAWGSEPVLRLLRWRYGSRLRWRRAMGGMFRDLYALDPEFDPRGRVPGFVAYWGGVSSRTGMPYPDGLAWVYRSTVPACRAVKAAELQGEEVAGRVLRRLREATFVFGRPPDDAGRLAAALGGVAGLDLDRLVADLDRPEVGTAYSADWEETRRPNEAVADLGDEGDGGGQPKEVEGRRRYAFPTLVFRGPGGEATVAGWKPLERYVEALEAVAPEATRDPPPDPSPEEVFTLWDSATDRELAVLCGDAARPPDGVVAVEAGGGRLWMTAAEARAAEHLCAASR